MTRPFQASRLLTSYRWRWALGLTTTIALCLCTRPLRAQASQPAASEVRVDCPELASEERSAIEARQMSELLSQGGAAGTLLLVCSGDRVSGTWQEGGVVLDSRFLSRNQGEGAVELLHWVASVLLEMRREREAERESGAAAVASRTGAAAPAQPQEIQPPAVATAAPASPEETVVASEPDAPPAVAAAPEAATRQKLWMLGLAAAYAHYGAEIAGAMGPRLTVSRRLARSLHVTAAFDVKAGLGSSEGFGVVDVSTALGASFDVLPFLSVTAAPLLVITTFSAPPATTGSTSPIVAGGLVASARARIPLEPLRPFLDLGVLAATPGRQVTLSDDAVLTVPAWQALVAVGVELPL